MRFNLIKNSVINYFMPIIFQSQKKQNMLIFIQEKKVTKDLVFVIFGFLNPIEILRLYKTSHVFNQLIKEYNNSLISLKDAGNQHSSAKREFEEQKNLLQKKSSRARKMIFLFPSMLGVIQGFGIMNLTIASWFLPFDNTEVFMRTSYQQFSCPNNRVGNALETLVCAEMIFLVVVAVGKTAMVCTNSGRQRKKTTLAAENLYHTAFYYLEKKEQTQSQPSSQPNFSPLP